MRIHSRRRIVAPIGRDGAEFYKKLGYALSERAQATARLWSMPTTTSAPPCWRLAKIGRHAEADAFAKTAMNYTNVFDAELGFVRGRKEDGSWCENFDPTEWGGPFTEGNSWHWTWSVFPDVPGLIKLMGGDVAFAKNWTRFLHAAGCESRDYGGMIHEMTEMVALNMGQYAHGNQPIQHAIYLYNYAGQPWKTQARARGS